MNFFETQAEHGYKKGMELKELNPTKAFGLFEKAAQKNHPAAQFELALAYIKGSGIESSKKQGVYWMERSANQGFTQAQYWMGMLYCYLSPEDLFDSNAKPRLYDDFALGFSPNSVESWKKKWLKNSYERYRDGELPLFDDEEAHKWFSLASQAIPQASYISGVLYAHAQDYDACAAEMKRAADTGMPEAQYIFARMMECGRTSFGVNIEGANKYYELACKQNFGLAQTRKGGDLLRDGYIDEGLVLLKKAAENGTEAASYQLGRYYFESKAYHNALDYLQRAQLFPEAKTLLGTMFAHGYGVGKDEAKALGLFEAASRQCPNDANILLEMSLVCNDDDRALSLLEKASELDPQNPEISYQLARHLKKASWKETGEARDKLLESSKAFYLKAIRLDHPSAMYEYASSFEDDPQTIVSYLEKAGELGHLESQLALGDLYSRSISSTFGVSPGLFIELEVDKTKARYWLEKAAAQGSGKARIGLGDIELHCHNYKTAFEQYEAASQTENDGWRQIALNAIAECYRIGLGVNKAPEKAFELYNLTPNNELSRLRIAEAMLFGEGHPKDEDGAFSLLDSLQKEDWSGCLRTLPSFDGPIEIDVGSFVEALVGYCFENGLGTEENAVRAVHHYENAIESNSPFATRQLALCYESGRGVDQNSSKAEELFRKAASLGDKVAQDWLQSRAKLADTALDNLVGLQSVKQEIASLKKTLEYEKARKDAGLPINAEQNRHMLFLGNPGTGKTTVARYIAQLLHQMGILSKGQLVETDRSGLVGEYIGHTEPKTKEKAQQAMGGVLFIDEAYALASRENNRDFGKDAINTLVKLMEDEKNNFVVIMAGYEKEMGELLASNSGLESRFHYIFHFEDYTTNELVLMFLKKMAAAKNTISDDALALVRENLDQARKAPRFGNGRYVANLLQRIEERHMNLTFNPEDPSTISHFVAADIPPYEKPLS